MYGIIHRFFKEFIPSLQGTNHFQRRYKRDLWSLFLVKRALGKTILARHLMGEGHLLMKRQQVLDTAVGCSKTTMDEWEILTHPKLILESPSFLRQTPHKTLKMLQS